MVGGMTREPFTLPRDELEASITTGYERLFRFVIDQCDEIPIAALQSDWRTTIRDAVYDIDRIVRRNAHPDDVMRARLAIGSLAGLWLTTDEIDELYATGKRP
jgi:hypothetical protein